MVPGPDRFGSFNNPAIDDQLRTSDLRSIDNQFGPRSWVRIVLSLGKILTRFAFRICWSPIVLALLLEEIVQKLPIFLTDSLGYIAII